MKHDIPLYTCKTDLVKIKETDIGVMWHFGKSNIWVHFQNIAPTNWPLMQLNVTRYASH